MQSLYIHIPFCRRKCLYCSYAVNVYQLGDIDSYLRGMAWEAEQHRGEKLDTIYIGGGTPSLMGCSQIRKLFNLIAVNFDCSEVKEITFEMNPDDVEAEKIDLLLQQGVNRISLGVQSYMDEYLRYLGRIHSAQEAMKACRALAEQGVENLNIDLIYGYAGQSREEIIFDIKTAINSGCVHISLYSLTIDRNSIFHIRQVPSLDNEVSANYYKETSVFLAQAGYQQYEISNFSLPGRKSQHNLNYWQGGNYTGLGVAAHSHKDGLRAWNVSQLNEYFRRVRKGQSPQEGWERLDNERRLLEQLLFGLRMNTGINLRKKEESLGCCLSQEKMGLIDQMVLMKLLVRDGDILRASEAGRLVLDEIAVRLI